MEEQAPVPETKEEPKTSFREGMRGVWRHTKAHKKTLLVITLLGLISAGTNGFVPFITGRFLDSLIELTAPGTGLASTGAVPRWVFLLAAWALVQLVANIADWIIDRLHRTVSRSMELGIQAEGFIHLLRLPLSYHTDAHINGVLSRVSTASWRVTSVVRSLVQIMPQLLSVGVGIVLAASISGLLALVLAGGVLVYCVVLMFMLRPMAKADDEGHTVWNDRWNDAAEAVQQVASVKQATAEAHEAKKTRDAFYGVISRLWGRLDRTWSDMNFYQRMIVLATQFTVFVISVGLITQGEITIGELIALNGYAAMFFGPFVSMGYSWQTIQNGLTAAAHLERIFEVQPERYEPEQVRAPERTEGRVVYDHVSFQYTDEKHTVLHDISFTAAPGETIAFVGESGSGKSTAVSLLSGYSFPSMGNVLVDGVDTREWDLTALRRQIAVVPQEVVLFNDTLRTNIRYGSFEATDEEVEAAARKAHIDEFIRGLPQGYDTLVGERGIKLSVGQKQRIAIARAILRNPKILILDEPTSALDAQTEKLITKSLDELMAGRTTFIIAHRLSTVRKADKILVLQKGSIVEQGTHSELIQIENGVYRHLYDLHIGLHE